MIAFIGIVAFVVALLASVMIHEWGHYKTARHYGMKVTDFFVGFGTTLWSTKRGETEYGFKAIPAGGFVKIVGMTELDEVEPEDEPRAFYKQAPHKRAVVLSAGSFMHFVIFLLLLPIGVILIGNFDFSPTAQISTVTPCVLPQDQSADSTTCAKLPAAPGKAAGLRAGDVVKSLNGKAVTDFPDLSQAIRAHGPGKVTLVVDRGGKTVVLTPTLVGRPDSSDEGFLGAAPVVERATMGPVETLRTTRSYYWFSLTQTAKAFVAIPSKVPDLVRQTFGDETRDPNGLVGVVGTARISGEILDQKATDWPSRLGSFVLIIATLNLFVGVFNLLPFLPLDGGHLAILGFEQVRSWWARVRHRPDPGRVDLRKVMPAAYLFLAVLIGLTFLLLAADLINPVRLPS